MCGSIPDIHVTGMLMNRLAAHAQCPPQIRITQAVVKV